MVATRSATIPINLEISVSNRAMQNSRFLVLTMLLVAGFPAATAAAELLSWEDCLAEASRNNAELRSAQATLESTRALERAAYSGFWPQLSAGISHTDISGNAVSTINPSYNASVIATQNLFAGFQDSAKVEQAGGNRAAAEAALDSTRARLSLDLKNAYAGLRYAQENVSLTARIVQRLEENLRLVELRYESGRENRGSFLLTSASLAQARFENLQARQAIQAARTQLARVLGRRESAELEASGKVPLNEPGPEPQFADLVHLTPDYRATEAQEKVASADLRLARAGFYPSVNLTGSIGREGGDWFPEDERRTIIASVSVPLFNGGRDYYATRGASASLEATRFNKDNVERQVLVRLRQTYNAYVESAEKLKVDQAFLDAASTRAEIARSKYNNGLMSFEDWDRIETDLVQRAKALLASQRERVAAEAAWEQTQGKGVIP